MATLKHIASKNSDYTAIEAYLVYQHDAFTGKQLLDEQGRPKLRDSYLLDTLECGDFSFATACPGKFQLTFLTSCIHESIQELSPNTASISLPPMLALIIKQIYSKSSSFFPFIMDL